MRKVSLLILSGALASVLAIAGTPPGQPAGGMGEMSGQAVNVQGPATEGEYSALRDEVNLVAERVKLAEEQAKLAKLQAQLSTGESEGAVLQPGATAQVVSVRGLRSGGSVATLLLPSGGLLDVSVGDRVSGVGKVVSMGAGGVKVLMHGHEQTLAFVTPAVGNSGAGDEAGNGPPLPGSQPVPISPAMPPAVRPGPQAMPSPAPQQQ